ncbi:unnamed protein product [Enterobius vermicularis]|uniref:DMAP-interaction domain-containing protein n=1 Tax=Enterobius vermicularis TaxID=51028 RepID=A0A0N4UZZ7_ENTVE|nr:unnamed protein product [Enterobius vermicularis]
MGDIDLVRLPSEVREHLAQLDLELSEGDITQKGYDKKRQLLLAPYIQAQANGNKGTASPSTKAHKRHQRRLTRDESRFHSEIRAEAVQQALAEYSKGTKEHPKVPQPIKRRGGNSFCERKNRVSDSSSDDESTLGSTNRSRQSGSTRSKDSRERLKKNRIGRSSGGDVTHPPPPDVTNGAVAVDARAQKRQVKDGQGNNRSEEICALECTSGLGLETIPTTCISGTDNSDLKDRVVYANTVTSYTEQDSNQEYQNAIIPLKPAKVSLKIQQLLHSLQNGVIAGLPFQK